MPNKPRNTPFRPPAPDSRRSRGKRPAETALEAEAEVEVRASPDGTIVGTRLVKSSGNPAWDQAVIRALEKTDTLPKDTDGRVPSSFQFVFRPHD